MVGHSKMKASNRRLCLSVGATESCCGGMDGTTVQTNRRRRRKCMTGGAASKGGGRGGRSDDVFLRRVNVVTSIGAFLPLLLVTFRGVKCYFQRSPTSIAPRVSRTCTYATRCSWGRGYVALISTSHQRQEHGCRRYESTPSSLRFWDQTYMASRTRLLSTAAPPSGSEVEAGLKGRSVNGSDDKNGASINGKSKKTKSPSLETDWRTEARSSFTSNDRIDVDAAANFLYDMMSLGDTSNGCNGKASQSSAVQDTGSSSTAPKKQKSSRRNRKTITRIKRNLRLSPKSAESSPSGSQQVTPLTSSSKKKRMDTANAILEGKFFPQQLSDPTLPGEMPTVPVNKDNIFYDENGVIQTAQKPRPKGRPASVGGAMSKATVARLNRLQSARLSAEQNPVLDLDTAAEFVARVRGVDTPEDVTDEKVEAALDVGTGVEADTSNTLQVVLDRDTIEGTDDGTAEDPSGAEKPKKARKRGRPRSKANVASDAALKLNPKAAMDDAADFAQSYYRTELLTPHEEYALGIKVQFMVRAEHIHEGICRRHGRYPTMKEWAAACGFVEESRSTGYEKYEGQLRPKRSEALLTVKDPDMFVGKGTVRNAGPGRGRGRPRQPPPEMLGDYFDDSALKAELALRKNTRGNRKKKRTERGGSESDADDTILNELQLAAKTPINRGTPQDFVDMLLASREAKRRIIKCNMRLVVSIARRYTGGELNLADVIQEGSLGLARAAEKYEPERGFRFSTYASWWIQQSILRGIANTSRTIRLPLHVHHLLNRVLRVRRTLQQDLGRMPNTDEVAEQLGITGEKYSKMIELTRRCISLELPKYPNNPKNFGSNDKKVTIGDTIDATLAFEEVKPEKRLDQGFLQKDLKEMLQILSEDERNVLTWKYGLSDGVTRTATAVALKMRQSKGWVRSNESRALRKLRRPWYEKKLYEHTRERNFSQSDN